jgi:NAD(P)-dependent dehydrogenase (short-subunit alcohol dehydrogenase family)
MDIEGCTAFVTGANRGIGAAYARALLEAGAAKVYAGARDPKTLTDQEVLAVKLDVTSPADVAAAAELCADVNLLINNAGIMLASPMLADGSDEAMRREMEVNVYGVLAMTRAFAPLLGRNGGGAIANVLSVASWFTPGYNATYAASKHAAEAVTDGTRLELRKQGTLVVAVHAGFVDTDMVGGMDVPKTPPKQVVDATLQALREGAEVVLADDRARYIWDTTRKDPGLLRHTAQAQWDALQD